MNDLVKRIQEVDEKIKKEEVPRQELAEYARLLEQIRDFSNSESTPCFSKNLDKFEESRREFIDYVKAYSETDEVAVLYLLRKGNVIVYGKYNHGHKIDKHTIEMVSDGDLRTLYESLQNEFQSSLGEGHKHTYGEGWSLNPTIGENLIIDIDSDNSNDKSWFYQEIRKTPGKKPLQKNK